MVGELKCSATIAPIRASVVTIFKPLKTLKTNGVAAGRRSLNSVCIIRSRCCIASAASKPCTVFTRIGKNTMTTTTAAFDCQSKTNQLTMIGATPTMGKFSNKAANPWVLANLFTLLLRTEAGSSHDIKVRKSGRHGISESSLLNESTCDGKTTATRLSRCVTHSQLQQAPTEARLLLFERRRKANNNKQQQQHHVATHYCLVGSSIISRCGQGSFIIYAPKNEKIEAAAAHRQWSSLFFDSI